MTNCTIEYYIKVIGLIIMGKVVVAFDFDGCMDLIDFAKDEKDPTSTYKEELLKQTMYNTMNPWYDEEGELVDFNSAENQNSTDRIIERGYEPSPKMSDEKQFAHKVVFLRAKALRDFPAIRAFKNILQDAKKNGHKVIVRCASNRQSKVIDNGLCTYNKHGLTADACFKAMFPPNQKLNDVEVTYNAARLEDTVKTSIEVPNEQKEVVAETVTVPIENTKFATLIDQIHAEAANLQSNESMTYTFMDDRKDILDRANKFFSENPYLIPEGVELKMIHTPQSKRTEEQSYQFIRGTGVKLDNDQRTELVSSITTEITEDSGYHKYKEYGWPRDDEQVAPLIEKIKNKFNAITDRQASTIALDKLEYGDKEARKLAKKSLEVLLKEDTLPDLEKMKEILEARISKKMDPMHNKRSKFFKVMKKLGFSKTANLLKKVGKKLQAAENQGSTSAVANNQNSVNKSSGDQRPR